MSANRVAITGMGIVSAIGNTVGENLLALTSQKSGLFFEENSDHILPSKWMGKIKMSRDEILKKLDWQDNEVFNKTVLFGAIAVKEALNQANFMVDSKIKTGFINATSVGGMDLTEEFYFDYLETNDNLNKIKAHNAGFSSAVIAENFRIDDFVTTISTACSSAANAIMLGARMIKSGKIDRVVVGGVDALTTFTINGFNALKIYSDEWCKPFDANRNGLNLGEAAAYLVLESEKSLQITKNETIAFVCGYGNANDAFHQTASSDNGEGAYLAMKKALEMAQISANEIDYINAHGTATPNNDASEGNSILRLFNGEIIPDFSSTKAFTGHTLAAAGAIEAVFSILALQEGKIWPNLNFDSIMPDSNLKPVTSIKDKPLKYVLSNSLGFGGNCSSLIFSSTNIPKK